MFERFIHHVSLHSSASMEGFRHASGILIEPRILSRVIPPCMPNINRTRPYWFQQFSNSIGMLLWWLGSRISTRETLVSRCDRVVPKRRFRRSKSQKPPVYLLIFALVVFLKTVRQEKLVKMEGYEAAQFYWQCNVCLPGVSHGAMVTIP